MKRAALLMAVAILALLSFPAERIRAALFSTARPLLTLFCSPKSNREDLLLEITLLKGQIDRFRELMSVEEELEQALFAKIIYRSPTTWNSTCWIDVGEEDNRTKGRTIVAKNSPVVSGNSLIGIVDLVENRQSRVRLLTDPGFHPSVRATRGEPQNLHILEQLDSFCSLLAQDSTLLPPGERRDFLLNALLDIQDQLRRKTESSFLAKGELCGSASALWRREGSTLRGTGFNYDYSDRYGAAQQIGGSNSLLKVDDLLITTGLDGLLPEGLHVAIVTKVSPLEEGDYFYEIEASPSKNLNSITYVSVLSPLSSS